MGSESSDHMGSEDSQIPICAEAKTPSELTRTTLNPGLLLEAMPTWENLKTARRSRAEQDCPAPTLCDQGSGKLKGAKGIPCVNYLFETFFMLEITLE